MKVRVTDILASGIAAAKALFGDGTWKAVAFPIDVSQEGTPVVTDLTNLNFTGAGVTVTDDGSGQASVDIPGGGGTGGVNLEKIGVPVSGGPFDTLNFKGSATTSVVDAGGGTADITLTAGGGGGGGAGGGLFDISMGVPLLADLTPVGPTYCVYTENPGLGINVANTSSVGGNSTLLGWTKPKPATEFHVAILMLHQLNRQNYYRPQIGVYNSANGRFETIGANIDDSTAGQTELATWSAYNNRTATAAITGPYSQGPFWMHVKFDGTNIKYGYSLDGCDVYWSFTRTLADYVGAITDIYFGFFAFDASTLRTPNLTVLCYDEDGDARVMGVEQGGGGGGSIEVDKNGVSIVADATKLNFTGSGVTVTDAGGGQANIAIPGGSSGGAYRPMVDGSLPPNLMYQPDGSLIMEPFTP